MRDCPIDCLPRNLIYYTSTTINRRGQTRFNIDTYFFNPHLKDYIQLKLPIESILLYLYVMLYFFKFAEWYFLTLISSRSFIFKVRHVAVLIRACKQIMVVFLSIGQCWWLLATTGWLMLVMPPATLSSSQIIP